VLIPKSELDSLNDENAIETDSENETLTDDESSTGSSDGKPKPTKTERIIIGNYTQDQALQLNGPIGKDLWAHISRIKICGNRAVGQSIQVNYRTTFRALEVAAKLQRQNIAAANQAANDSRPRTVRHDSVIEQ
jgi:hypothetical protein